MTRALEWFETGGPLMPALLAVGLVLYLLLFAQLLALARRRPPSESADVGLMVVRALIGAAPLLGLLGTVTGLITGFDAMLREARLTEVGQGIAHALHTTQYGMALAAPALLMERFIHRRTERAQRHPREARP